MARRKRVINRRIQFAVSTVVFILSLGVILSNNLQQFLQNWIPNIDIALLALVSGLASLVWWAI